MIRGVTEKGASSYHYDALGRRIAKETSVSGTVAVTATGAEAAKRLEYVPDFTSRRNDDLCVYAEGFFKQDYAYANGQRISQTTSVWADTAGLPGTGAPWIDAAGTAGMGMPKVNARMPMIPEELYIHEDIMGSARRFTGADGSTFAEIEYDVWGLPAVRGGGACGGGNGGGLDVLAGFTEYGETLNPRYTNHTYDATLGMYHAQYRFFDAENRGFTQVDPVKDTLNWYGYCGGNPASYVDSMGLANAPTPQPGPTRPPSTTPTPTPNNANHGATSTPQPTPTPSSTLSQSSTGSGQRFVGVNDDYPHNAGSVSIRKDGTYSVYDIYVPPMVNGGNVIDMTGYNEKISRDIKFNFSEVLAGLSLDDFEAGSIQSPELYNARSGRSDTMNVNMPTSVSVISLLDYALRATAGASTTTRLKATEYKVDGETKIVLQLSISNPNIYNKAGKTNYILADSGISSAYIYRDMLKLGEILGYPQGTYADFYLRLANERKIDSFYMYLYKDSNGNWCGYQRKFECESHGYAIGRGEKELHEVYDTTNAVELGGELSAIIDKLVSRINL